MDKENINELTQPLKVTKNGKDVGDLFVAFVWNFVPKKNNLFEEDIKSEEFKSLNDVIKWLEKNNLGTRKIREYGKEEEEKQG